jgi:hypothetical protein
MNAKRSTLALVLVLSSFVFFVLMLALSLPMSSAQSDPSVASDAVPLGVGAPAGLRPLPESDVGEDLPSSAPLAIALPDACAPPIVEAGSIVTGVNPVQTARLNRNGVPSVCGEHYTCAGVLNLGTHFSYEKFDFINPSSHWQCVHVAIDPTGCGQQVYSAAYLNSFNPADLCENNQGAMGYSFVAVYGYSFMVPPSTDFSVVNNTLGVLPPGSNCASYVMTTSLCTTDLALTATKRPLIEPFHADSTGKAVVPVEVLFHNSGTYTEAVSAASVSETVSIAVQDNQPAAASATFGHAGAIVPPGGMISQTVMLAFSGSQFKCLSRIYEVTSDLDVVVGVYDCNGFNPPSAGVVAGSISPDPNFDEDSIAFQSQAGVYITATVDTVSAGTAFDVKACLSGTPGGACLPGLEGDNDFNCTFAPPAHSCPRFGGLLPPDPDGDDIYYLRVGSGSGALNFAGPTGDYRATVLVASGHTGACPLVPVLDNGASSFLSLAEGTTSFGAMESNVLTATVKATVQPITILVPPANPGSPDCGLVYLPIVIK